MLEFSSISVSTYDSVSLADRLTERSAEGWDVVSIVQTGTTVTAFISRPLGAVSPVILPEVIEATPIADTADPRGHNADGDTTAVAKVSEESSYAMSSASSGARSTGVLATSQVSTSAGTDTTTAAAPAGWYADPANRFELRYWDGDKWTEYVSRGGQQFTDPPVA